MLDAKSSPTPNGCSSESEVASDTALAQRLARRESPARADAIARPNRWRRGLGGFDGRVHVAPQDCHELAERVQHDGAEEESDEPEGGHPADQPEE